MLTLPPKMETAFQRGEFEPMTYVEITTAVLDAPAAQQRRRYYGTIEGKEGVELLYPAQPGDPTQTEPLYRSGFSDRILLLIASGPLNGLPFSTGAFQTFTVGEDVHTASRVKKVTVKFTRFFGDGRSQLRCRLYPVDRDGNLLDFGGRRNILTTFGGGIESATVFTLDTIAASPATSNLEFIFDAPLIPGQKYAVLPYLVFGSVTLTGNANPFLGWYGEEQPVPGESARSVSNTGETIATIGGNFSLQVDVAAYSYNGDVVNRPHVEVDIDLNGTPVSEGFISLRDARPTFRDPVSGVVKKTDILYHLWAGNSLGGKDVDLGVLSDGAKISVFRNYYTLRAELVTVNTTTLLRTPVFKGVNLSFPQVVAGAPKTYAFSSHAAPFTLAPAVEKCPSLPTRLDPRSHVTQRGGFSIALVDINGEVTRIATEEHLLNLPVEVRVGHIAAASKEDLLLVGQGIITDYDFKPGRLTLKVEDRTKQLSVKIPKRSIKDSDYVQSGGVANAYTITFNPPFTAYTDKMVVPWKVHTKNTLGSTANVDGLGAKSIVKLVNGAYVALVEGDLPQGRKVLMVLDLPGNRWILADTVLLGTDFRRDHRFKHMVDVLSETIIDDAGIARRWVDTAKFGPIKTYLDGADPVSKWITGHVQEQQDEARKMVDELCMLLGIYLPVREEGLLTPILYPRSEASVDTWDETVIAPDDSQPDGLAATLVNACIVVFDRDGDGSFLGASLAVDVDAQEAWAPGSETFVADRVIKTRWLGSEIPFNGETLSQRIARREIKARANGMAPLRVKTGLSRCKPQVGDFVTITSPAFLRKHQLGAAAKQFMAIMKDTRWDEGCIYWDLLEVIDANRPPTASFTATPEKGTPPFTVDFDGSGSVDPDGTIIEWAWDFDYDLKNFTVDAVGSVVSYTYPVTAAGVKTVALRVTDDHGATHIATRQIRVRKAPVAVITYQISDPTQPLFAVLTSASYGITGAIVKTEWDFQYTGVFTVDAVGHTATVNLPYQTLTVALRVTDEDGLTDIETITLEGKTLAPATPTNFFVRQNKDLLDLQWDDNPEGDILGFEARIKYEPTGVQTATFENSDLLFSSARTTSRTVPVNRPYGYYTILLKAINSSRRKSIDAVSIFIKILDPQDRNVILTRDEKALGWPGTLVQLVKEVANNRLWIGAPAVINDLPLSPINSMADTPIALTPGTYSQGTYETPVIDLGAILSPIRLSALPTTNSTPSPTNTSALVEYKISDDNVVWTTYQSIRYGADLAFRYLQLKYTGKQLDNASNIALENLVTTIDVPDLLDSNEDVDVAVGGTAVLFGVVFNIIPSVHTSIQNMLVPHFVDIYSKSKTGFSMKVRVRLPGSGTISTSGTAATTSAAHGLAIGDAILILTGPQAGEYKRVTDVPTSTTATLESAFSVNQSGQSWDRGKDVGSGGLRLVDWEAIGY